MTERSHPQPAGAGSVDAGRSAPVAAKAAAIDAAQAHPLTWKAVVKRALVVAVAGAAIYLVMPELMAVLGAWPRLSTLNPVWFAVVGYAVLATLAYRVASYWLPLLAGPPAYLLFRHRYGRPVRRRATPSGGQPAASSGTQ